MDILYEFEHKALPHLLHKEKSDFIYALVKKKDMMFGMVDSVFRKFNKENPYSKDDFKVEPVKLSASATILKLSFPEPEIAPMCYWAYVFFDREFSNLAYFTVEMNGIKFRPEDPSLCGWEENGMHSNYGIYKLDEETILKECIDIYQRSAKE